MRSVWLLGLPILSSASEETTNVCYLMPEPVILITRAGNANSTHFLNFIQLTLNLSLYAKGYRILAYEWSIRVSIYRCNFVLFTKDLSWAVKHGARSVFSRSKN